MNIGFLSAVTIELAERLDKLLIDDNYEINLFITNGLLRINITIK